MRQDDEIALMDAVEASLQPQDELVPVPLERTAFNLAAAAVGLALGFGGALAVTVFAASYHRVLPPTVAETFAMFPQDGAPVREDKLLAPIQIKTVPIPATAPPPPDAPIAAVEPEAPAAAPAAQREDVCQRHGMVRQEFTTRRGWHAWRCRMAHR